jgi:hypothetical protein
MATRARRAPARTPKTRPRPAPQPSETRQQRERRADAVLELARFAEPARRPSPDTSTSALRKIRDELDFICSCAIVVRRALIEQNCELDEDAARVLKRCVSDELAGQIERIDSLLGVRTRDDLDKDNNEAGSRP